MRTSHLLVVGLLLCSTAWATPRKQVVVVAGLPGVGKTTLCTSLARTMNARRHTCGDVVRGWIRAQGLPYNPQNDRMASRHFAQTPGEIARQLSFKIQRSRKQLHIVDGVRSPADLKVLQQHFDVRVVALSAPRKVRYDRMLARQRFEHETVDYLQNRDRREIGLGVLHLLRRPFTRVDMSGPLGQVPHQARLLADQLNRSFATRY